jgi:hypothetical protein
MYQVVAKPKVFELLLNVTMPAGEATTSRVTGPPERTSRVTLKVWLWPAAVKFEDEKVKFPA